MRAEAISAPCLMVQPEGVTETRSSTALDGPCSDLTVPTRRRGRAASAAEPQIGQQWAACRFGRFEVLPADCAQVNHTTAR